jgi:hypothetical protein
MFVMFFNADYSCFYADNFYKEMLSHSTTDSRLANTLSLTLPSDAAVMQIGIQNAQINWGGGSVYVDDAVMNVVPEPSTAASLLLDPLGLRAFPKHS